MCTSEIPDPAYNEALHIYLRKSQHLGLWPVTEKAMHLVGSPSHQIVVADIGCGSGRDALPLLASGAKVICIDNSQVAVELLKAGAQAIGKESELTIVQEKMENLPTLPSVDLVVACVSLPYCHPANFMELWAKMKQMLKPEGIFAGHFFGTRDSWHGCDFVTTHTEEELRSLFAEFEISDLEVTEEDKLLPDGSTAHRHTYHVVAQMRRRDDL